MNLTTLNESVSPAEAKELYAEYHAALKAGRPALSPEADAEIAAAYRHIGAGRRVVVLDDVLRAGGLNADGLPALAICLADAEYCYWQPRTEWEGGRRVGSGGGVFSAREGRFDLRNANVTVRVAPRTFDGAAMKVDGGWGGHRARVPLVPPRYRPSAGTGRAHALSNYHLLFEAEWEPVPPVDPALLKRVAPRSRMFVVLATWDLTPVERAALARAMEG